VYSDRQQFQRDLARALPEADFRVLLMALFHLTGDRYWLSERFRPRRDVNLVPDPKAGLSDEVRQEICSAVERLFAEGMPQPAIHDPGNDLMREMMTVCLGENVPPEYAPLIREEMALVGRDPEWRCKPSREELARRSVLIVGAGVCGLGLAAKLGLLGIPYTIVEKNDDLGGTWYVNRFPGCGVDTPNHSYSFSFGPRYPWSRYFSPRAEIHDYLKLVAETFDIRRNIRFRTRLLSSRWDERTCRWISSLEDEDGVSEHESAFLVSAVGQLNDPHKPTIPGVDDFRGDMLHSINWHEDIAVKGRNISVIGTGATAMQLVPTIADDCRRLTVYQRTPQWSRPIPGYSDPISDGIQWLLRHMPYYAEWFRFSMFWRYGDGLLPLLRKDPDWPHPDRAVNKTNDRHREEMTRFILQELEGREDLIRKCVPTYPPYGKRILLDNGWYRTLRKDNVELVDTPIDTITATGIRTIDGTERPADLIVLSIGFKVTEMAARLNITGRDGLDLRTAWAPDNPTAYLGLTVPKFPNFFCMLGPNTGPGHGGSVIFQAECQIRYLTSCLVAMIEAGARAMEIRKDVHDAYNERVDAEHAGLIWSHPGMTTYYRNSQGRVFSVSPWRFVDYWAMTHDPELGEYHLTFDQPARLSETGAGESRQPEAQAG